MKWWLEYDVTITFKDFPWPCEDDGKIKDEEKSKFLQKENFMELRACPLHQCTDNIHLRLNNRDLISYTIQMLNQRMEYWQQDKLKESCGFCPHRKPNVQDTCYLGKSNTGRSPFLNIGSSYDGDFGNEVVMGKITFKDSEDNYKGTSEMIKAAVTTGSTSPAVYVPYKKCSGTLSFSMREPVMVEPLDYFSSKAGNKTMNNVSSIDLEYNFNNLRNMILFNHATMLSMAKGAVGKDTDKLKATTTDWMYSYLLANLETAMTVAITDATLIIDVATLQVDPEFPFVTDYVEYRRYETMSSERVYGLAVARNRDQTSRLTLKSIV